MPNGGSVLPKSRFRLMGHDRSQPSRQTHSNATNTTRRERGGTVAMKVRIASRPRFPASRCLLRPSRCSDSQSRLKDCRYRPGDSLFSLNRSRVFLVNRSTMSANLNTGSPALRSPTCCACLPSVPEGVAIAPGATVRALYSSCGRVFPFSSAGRAWPSSFITAMPFRGLF